MRDFTQPQEFVVEDMVLRTAHGGYRGEGFLDWDPSIGFRLRGVLTRDQTPFPARVVMAVGPVITRSRRVLMRPQGYDWAVGHIAEPPLPDSRIELDERIRSLRLRARLPRARKHGEDYGGFAVLRVQRDLYLPDTLAEEVSVAGQVVRKALERRGLNFHGADPGLELVAYARTPGVLEASWRLPAAEWARSASWRWAGAFRYALCILTGQYVQTIAGGAVRAEREYTEVSAADEPRSLQYLAPLGFQYRWDAADFAKLACFLAVNHPMARVSREIFDHLAEASQQRTWESRCLLTGTILEAVLRNVENRPFVPRQRDRFLREALERFCKARLGPGWKAPEMSRVLAAYEGLRHRYAHPDWGLGGQQGKGALLADMNHLLMLARFYGTMILAFAGFENLEPHFPEVHDALTVQFGDRPGHG